MVTTLAATWTDGGALRQARHSGRARRRQRRTARFTACQRRTRRLRRDARRRATRGAVRSAPDRFAEIELRRLREGAGAGADGRADEGARADADTAESQADEPARAGADGRAPRGAVALSRAAGGERQCR